MRLIDADELKNKIFKERNYFSEEKTPYIIGCIEEAPTVDLWRYPSRGEYPPLTNHKSWSDDVLCECTDGKYRVGHYVNTMGQKASTQWDNWRFEFGMERKGIVVRWQYIEPPKEEA